METNYDSKEIIRKDTFRHLEGIPYHYQKLTSNVLARFNHFHVQVRVISF